MNHMHFVMQTLTKFEVNGKISASFVSKQGFASRIYLESTFI